MTRLLQLDGAATMVFRYTEPIQTGDDIRRIQMRLAYFGFGAGGIDGVFGPGTERAVRRFQDWADLTVTGEVDPDLATTMGLDLFDREGSGASPIYRPLGSELGLSDASVDFLAFHETGGQFAYERSNAHPTWPGVNSGVTIGVGYDLGYHSRADFEDAWRDYLDPTAYDLLAEYVGLHAGEMDPVAAKARFGEIIDGLTGVEIPWQAAMKSFAVHTLPEYASQTAEIFPDFNDLPGSCRGALVSLVYNRGARLNDSATGVSRQEMRDIRDHLAAGELDEVPEDFRRMASRWPTSAGLQRRRREEAELFAWGVSVGE